MRLFFCIFFIAIIFTGIQSCDSKKGNNVNQAENITSGSMRATILRKKVFPEIPSASGMEVIGDNIYIVGDDSPFLFILDLKTFRLLNQIRLFESFPTIGNRIPKAFKADLECMTTLVFNGETYLVAFGSGSAPTRAGCYVIQLPEGTGTAAKITEYSIKDLYIALQSDKSLLAGDLLNIEAAATSGNKLFLLQRSAQAGPNALLSFDIAEFMNHLTRPGQALPAHEQIMFELPALSELNARFSGAYTFTQLLFFAASVENTNDAILDGEVMGSFIGMIGLDTIKPGQERKPLHIALVLDEKGKPYKGKIESVVILDANNAGTYKALAVTDNDDGASELLELQIVLQQ